MTQIFNFKSVIISKFSFPEHLQLHFLIDVIRAKNMALWYGTPCGPVFNLKISEKKFSSRLGFLIIEILMESLVPETHQ